MKQAEKTEQLLILHCNTYPELQLQDIFKYLYQSSFGCEHMVLLSDAVKEYINKELLENKTSQTSNYLTEPLDGDYSRVHLSCINDGLNAGTLAKLFVNSSKKENNGLENLKCKLEIVKKLAFENKIPFSTDKVEKEIKNWELNGFPPVHHSEAFREKYKPSYRVIANKYAKFIKLFASIDKLLEAGMAIIAIEGGSASGKSTLAQALSEIYDCTVLHTDDFFLQPHQRTKERLEIPGGNIDYERFFEEVVIPLNEKKDIEYRKFNCFYAKIMPEIKITPKPLTIIEGAYSMHPKFGEYFDLSVFLDVSPKLQKERIQKRNSPELAQRFFNEWIPYEKNYFSKYDIKKRCTISFDV